MSVMKTAKPRVKAPSSQQVMLEACILAGGLSTRMGRDKSRLRLGRRTMTGIIRATVGDTGIKARVIRRDAVPRCGPLGGIYTALKSSRADLVFILACDMPFVSAKLLDGLRRKLRAGDKAVFVREKGVVGFPCLLRREDCSAAVLQQIKRGELSLQKLARVLKARMLQPTRSELRGMVNINTLAEFEKARKEIASL